MHKASPKLPTNTALLLIDVQKGFDQPERGTRNNLHAESNIARLLAAWRLEKQPIFHVFHDSIEPASTLHPSHPAKAPKPEAEPHAGEPVYRKTVNSGFIGTTLEADLRSAGIGTLVIAGLTTNHCVSTTTRMAGNLGFDTYIVSDATATFNRAGLDGRNRQAEEVHAAALSDLHEEFATVTDTATILNALGHPIMERNLAPNAGESQFA